MHKILRSIFVKDVELVQNARTKNQTKKMDNLVVQTMKDEIFCKTIFLSEKCNLYSCHSIRDIIVFNVKERVIVPLNLKTRLFHRKNTQRNIVALNLF